jgi:hypothetical protein
MARILEMIFAPRFARYREVMDEKLDRQAVLVEETRKAREEMEKAARAWTKLEREVAAVEGKMRGRS